MRREPRLSVLIVFSAGVSSRRPFSPISSDSQSTPEAAGAANTAEPLGQVQDRARDKINIVINPF